MLPLLLSLSLIPLYVQDGYNPPPDPVVLFIGEAPPQTTTTTTAPAPIEQSAYRGMGNGSSDVEQWRPLVAGHFPPEQVENALCVIRSESGGNQSAKNTRSEARGLFQVMASVWASHYGVSYADLYSPEINSYVAAQIWGDAGWKPWSPRTRRNCGL